LIDPSLLEGFGLNRVWTPQEELLPYLSQLEADPQRLQGRWLLGVNGSCPTQTKNHSASLWVLLAVPAVQTCLIRKVVEKYLENNRK
jgi:hypothetical protein